MDDELQDLKYEYGLSLGGDSPLDSSADLGSSIKLKVSASNSEGSDEAFTTVKTQSDQFIGTTIGDRYEVLSLVGQGSTTAVYKAQDTKEQRLVAVKILRAEFASSEGTVRRFDQECKTLKLLTHNNIVSYFGKGTTQSGLPYFVMEYLDGTSLKQLIDDKRLPDYKRTLRIFIQICAALASAHEKGVVHRDLKPANIMITTDDQGNDVVKILDFGVAKLLMQGETFQTKTQTGEMLGTLLYMSPEQCLDQDLDGRSDIYSLGCVLFEALTGMPPLTGRTAFETMNKHMTQLPLSLAQSRPDLGLPQQLDSIIHKAVAKEPQKRYQNISLMQQDLSTALSGGIIERAPRPLSLMVQSHPG